MRKNEKIMDKKKEFVIWLLEQVKDVTLLVTIHEGLGFIRYSFDQWNQLFADDIDMQFSIDEMRKTRKIFLSNYTAR